MCHKVVPTWSKWCSMLPLGRSGRLEILVWCCAKRSIYREARQRRDDDHRCQASQLESLLRRLEVSCSSAKRLASDHLSNQNSCLSFSASFCSAASSHRCVCHMLNLGITAPTPRVVALQHALAHWPPQGNHTLFAILPVSAEV